MRYIKFRTVPTLPLTLVKHSHSATGNLHPDRPYSATSHLFSLRHERALGITFCLYRRVVTASVADGIEGISIEIDVPKERPAVLILRRGSWATLCRRSTRRRFAMYCFPIKVLRYARAFGAPPPNTDPDDRACIAVECIQDVKFWPLQSSKRTLQCLFGRWSVEQSDRRPHRKGDTSKKQKTAPVAQLHVQLPFSEARSRVSTNARLAAIADSDKIQHASARAEAHFVWACAV